MMESIPKSVIVATREENKDLHEEEAIYESVDRDDGFENYIYSITDHNDNIQTSMDEELYSDSSSEQRRDSVNLMLFSSTSLDSSSVCENSVIQNNQVSIIINTRATTTVQNKRVTSKNGASTSQSETVVQVEGQGAQTTEQSGENGNKPAKKENCCEWFRRLLNKPGPDSRWIRFLFNSVIMSFAVAVLAKLSTTFTIFIFASAGVISYGLAIESLCSKTKKMKEKPVSLPLVQHLGLSSFCFYVAYFTSVLPYLVFIFASLYALSSLGILTITVANTRRRELKPSQD